MFYPDLNNAQDIWINGVPQNGVRAVNFNADTPKAEINILGKQSSNLIIDGVYSYGLSMSKNFLMQDYIWASGSGVTGASITFGFDADREASPNPNIGEWILADGGVLTNVSLSANVGSVPTITYDWKFDGSTGFFTAWADGSPALATSTAPEGVVEYVPQTGISLNLGGAEGSGIVQSATFNVSYDWKKIPVVVSDLNDNTNRGGYFVSELVRPIKYAGSVTLAAKSYELNTFVFQNPQTWVLTIYGLGKTLGTFTIPNAELVSESVKMGEEGVPEVVLGYAGVGYF